ncbi:acyltransferase family protein [Caldimonas taiwanensis]|uniref:acyltransferase family protein n=1 Tax=Caldimonas taiwanensis TaxID=307483 RepID=UPI000781AB90|nr:acyltransferase family protein [Caldimonas taiwanensis]
MDFARQTEGTPHGIADATRPRSALIDVGKGLGILLVVLGHNPWFGDHLPWLDQLIGTFRMPLFFFLAGVTFPAGRGVVQTAWRRADALLKPYAVVVIAYALVRAERPDVTLESTVLSLVYATGFTLEWVPLWFLPHLWLLSVAAAAYLRWVSPWLRSVAWRVACLAAMAAAGAAVIHRFHNPVDDLACMHHRHFSAELWACGLPFSADVLLLSAFFFLVGHHLQSAVWRFKPTPWRLAAAAGLFVTLWLGFHQTLNFNFRSYGHGLIVPLQALAAIYLMLALCQRLAHWSPSRRLLTHVGRGSLFVLMFHAPVQSKVLDWLLRWPLPGALSMGLAFLGAVGTPMVLWAWVRRQPLLARLLLPVPAVRASIPWKTRMQP